jgi:autotransporter family porin
VNTSTLDVANQGTAQLTIREGGIVTNLAANLGITGGSQANVLVTGDGSRWTSAGKLTVADGGTATLDLLDGATLESTGTDVAKMSGSIGTLNVAGLGSHWNDSGTTIVGYGSGGDATLNILGGATVTSSQGVVGFSGGAVGRATVSGSGSVWTLTTGSLQIGSGGSGTVDILAGGKIDALANVTVANSTTSTGDITFDGNGSELAEGGNLLINSGLGSVTIDNGGKVAVAGSTTVGTGDTLTVANGTLTTTDFTNNGSFSFGGGMFEIEGGDALFNSSLSLGAAADTAPEFRVVNGADAAVTFSFALGNAADTHASAVVSGTSADGLRRSTLRGTSGGGGADLTVGGSGTGTLMVTGGGLVDLRDDFVVGSAATGQGNVTVSGVVGGFRSTIEANNGGLGSVVQIGVAGSGALTITDGALVTTSSSAFIGQSVGSNGTVYIGGRSGGLDATLEATADVTIGGVNRTGHVTIAEGGLLQVGNDLGVSTNGTLILDGGTLTVLGDEMNVSPDAVFDFRRGTLVVDGISLVDVPSGLTIPSAGTVQLAAPLDGPVRSLPGSTINITGSALLGLPNTFLGVNLQGVLNLGANTATLRSAGYAQLGELTTLSGGMLNSTNGILLGSGDVLTGTGVVVNSRIVAAAGSIIQATGNLFLGDSSRSDGFVGEGLIEIGPFYLELHDANQAVVGSLTHLGNATTAGTLVATNGLLADFGSNLEGYGTIDSLNDPLKPTIINGSAVGDSPANPLTFLGYVKGVGTFADVVFSGTFSPGLSPAAIDTGSLLFSSTSNLVIELGGTIPGNAYDQINSTGTLSLGGTLDVQLIGGFTPSFGDTFDIITATTVQDTFDIELLPTLAGNLDWIVDYQTDGVSLLVSLSGDFDLDGDVDGADFLKWQRGEVSNPPSQSDLTVWQSNFGNLSNPITAASTTVPEPATRIMLMLGVAALLFRRHGCQNSCKRQF